MYDSTFSSPCLRAAREKHRFAAGKKHRNGKKHVWQQEKNALQRKKAASAAGKNVSKKSRFAAGKIQSSKKKHLAAAKKHFCSRKNAFWRQREKTARGGKKRVRGKKKTGRGRKKTRSRESPALQPKKSPQRKKYISATGKSSSPFVQWKAQAGNINLSEKMCSAEVRRKPIGTNGVLDEALQREPRVKFQEDSKPLQQGDPLKSFEISSVAAADHFGSKHPPPPSALTFFCPHPHLGEVGAR